MGQDVFLDTAVEACREAGRLALDMQDRLEDVRFKGRKDIVTEADLACDARIRQRLSAAFPDHNIITEEERALEQSSPYTWYVDPIDGTVNYSRGLPLWGISVALQHEGRTLAAAIFLPVMDELYTAARDRGAQLNGKAIRASSVREPEQAIISYGDFNIGIDPAAGNLRSLEHRARLAGSVQRVKCLGSAVAEGVYVAAGRMEGFIMDTFKPWDVAAAALIVEEAGGRVSALDGSPWSLKSPDLLFSNGILHDALLRLLSL